MSKAKEQDKQIRQACQIDLTKTGRPIPSWPTIHSDGHAKTGNLYAKDRHAKTGKSRQARKNRHAKTFPAKTGTVSIKTGPANMKSIKPRQDFHGMAKTGTLRQAR